MEKLYKISLKNSMLMEGMIDFHDDLFLVGLILVILFILRVHLEK